jgi:hypothetical protein
MRVWCGDYDTDEWVIGLQFEPMVITIVVFLGLLLYYRYQMGNTVTGLQAKLKKCEDDCKKKIADNDAAWQKELDECEKSKGPLAKGARKEILIILDAKLREIQDSHRSTMITDNYNRIMWIAEGVRQSRDAVENSINSLP